MTPRAALAAACLLAALPALAAGAAPPRRKNTPAPAPAGAQALALVKTLVKSGQRYAGAPRRAQAIDGLARRLEAAGLEVERDAFTAKDPKDGTPRPMVNLLGRFRPQAKCRVLLGSHFDTRHVAEEDPNPANRGKPIPGADDGTSGVAVLLTLAKRLPQLAPKGLGVDIALFDGEEMGYPQVGGYCLGSEHYVTTPLLLKEKPKFGIILDMVCDEHGLYHIETNSKLAAPDVVRAVWKEGSAVAPEAFVNDEWLSIGDDHVSLSDAGVPSILVIGFNYPQWHTLEDTPARCSAERLGEIVETLSRVLKNDAASLARCGS